MGGTRREYGHGQGRRQHEKYETHQWEDNYRRSLTTWCMGPAGGKKVCGGGTENWVKKSKGGKTKKKSAILDQEACDGGGERGNVREGRGVGTFTRCQEKEQRDKRTEGYTSGGGGEVHRVGGTTTRARILNRELRKR